MGLAWPMHGCGGPVVPGGGQLDDGLLHHTRGLIHAAALRAYPDHGSRQAGHGGSARSAVPAGFAAVSPALAGLPRGGKWLWQVGWWGDPPEEVSDGLSHVLPALVLVLVLSDRRTGAVQVQAGQAGYGRGHDSGDNGRGASWSQAGRQAVANMCCVRGTWIMHGAGHEWMAGRRRGGRTARRTKTAGSHSISSLVA